VPIAREARLVEDERVARLVSRLNSVDLPTLGPADEREGGQPGHGMLPRRHALARADRVDVAAADCQTIDAPRCSGFAVAGVPSVARRPTYAPSVRDRRCR
jgi:hypothetical protein